MLIARENEYRRRNSRILPSRSSSIIITFLLFDGKRASHQDACCCVGLCACDDPAPAANQTPATSASLPHCACFFTLSHAVLVLSGRCHRLKPTWGTADEQGPVVLFGLKAGSRKLEAFLPAQRCSFPLVPARCCATAHIANHHAACSQITNFIFPLVADIAVL
ncbi:hypothetical protein TGAM01_v201656 [Trichoderma gamsii]|uniref:Uncharacterized protein n=1 Tax=Trichoderma gamsii TaxID=398673 RepID=A0A2P4ZYN1_9HYPO|nr:hypothetical protein TGAM01_v201656 [Trichoderma gamsii]PON29407.1 hypothetical protein TGAM01_v201656 [Trichoderma gamsii]